MSERGLLHIILVEDDFGHARLIQKNLRRAGCVDTLLHFSNGHEAIDYLFEGNGRQTLPTLILLDLNIPGCDGYQILTRLKNTPRTRSIPVVIVSTTDSPTEMARCYDLGCNLFITKPVDYKKFSDTIQKLGLLLSIIDVPGKRSPANGCPTSCPRENQ